MKIPPFVMFALIGLVLASIDFPMSAISGYSLLKITMDRRLQVYGHKGYGKNTYDFGRSGRGSQGQSLDSNQEWNNYVRSYDIVSDHRV